MPRDELAGGTSPRAHEPSAVPQDDDVVKGVRVVSEEDLPSEVHEANKTIGSDGKPVFQVYRPQGMSVVRRVD